MLYILPHQCCQRPCDKCQASPAFPYADRRLDREAPYFVPRIQIAPEQVPGYVKTVGSRW